MDQLIHCPEINIWVRTVLESDNKVNLMGNTINETHITNSFLSLHQEDQWHILDHCIYCYNGHNREETTNKRHPESTSHPIPMSHISGCCLV